MQETVKALIEMVKDNIEANKNVLLGLNSLLEQLGAGKAIGEAAGKVAAAVTLEDVRAALARKSRAGMTAQVKELLKKYGAAKLSEVKPDDYAALMEEAEELK